MRAAVVRSFLEAVPALCARRGVQCTADVIQQTATVLADPAIVKQFQKASQQAYKVCGLHCDAVQLLLPAVP